MFIIVFGKQTSALLDIYNYLKRQNLCHSIIYKLETKVSSQVVTFVRIKQQVKAIKLCTYKKKSVISPWFNKYVYGLLPHFCLNLNY